MMARRSREVLQVGLPGQGWVWEFAGPDVTYQIGNIRRVAAQERLLIPHLPQVTGRILVVLTGASPVLPALLAARNPEATVEVFTTDLHDARLLQAKLQCLPNVKVVCAADPGPVAGPEQCGVLAVSPLAERLAVFDLIERLALILPAGSGVLAALPKKRSADLLGRLNQCFGKGHVVTRHGGVVIYQGVSRGDSSWTPRLCQFEATTPRARVRLGTRPGVFGHGRPDAGGIALAESLESSPTERMLDLGCGAGTVGLLTAAQWQQQGGPVSGEILLVDSNARAIACAADNVAANGFPFVQTELTDRFVPGDRQFDVVVGNPPYFAEHRICAYFIRVAAACLRPGGRLWIVSKHGATVAELMQQTGFTVTARCRRGYDLTIGIRPEGPLAPPPLSADDDDEEEA